MASAKRITPKALSRTDDLREQLHQVKARIGQLGHASERQSWEILERFDTIEGIFAELLQEGHELRVEEALLEEVSAGLRSKSAVFLREIGGASQLKQARQKSNPPEACWWWYLDEWQAARRKGMLRRGIKQVAAGLAVLALLAFLYQRFLAPDEQTQAILEYRQRAFDSAMQGDWQRALELTGEGLEIAPSDTELLLLQSIIFEQLGQADDAARALALLETEMGDRAALLESRARIYLSLQAAEAAMADIMELLALQPDSPQAHYLLGGAYETLGRFAEALQSYERAGSLAEAQGQSELVAMARIRMGHLMMLAPSLQGQ